MAKKLVRIPTGHQRSSAVESKTQKRYEKGVGSSVSVNTTPTNRVIELASYDLLTSLVQRNFDRAVGGTTDGGTEWEIVNEIKKPYNTYPCSFIPHTKLTLDYIHRRLGGVSSVKTHIQAIVDTGDTHNMDPNYV